MAKSVVFRWLLETMVPAPEGDGEWRAAGTVQLSKASAERHATGNRAAERAWNNKRRWRVARYIRDESSVAPRAKRKGVR